MLPGGGNMFLLFIHPSSSFVVLASEDCGGLRWLYAPGVVEGYGALVVIVEGVDLGLVCFRLCVLASCRY